jgi:hypothetical protein
MTMPLPKTPSAACLQRAARNLVQRKALVAYHDRVSCVGAAIPTIDDDLARAARKDST